MRGESIPRYDKVVTLAEWLQIEPSDLVYGFKIREKSNDELCWQQMIEQEDKKLLEAFVKLPVAQRKIVREVILAFSQLQDK